MESEDAVSDDFEEILSRRAAGALPPDMLKEAAGDYENWSTNLKAYPLHRPGADRHLCRKCAANHEVAEVSRHQIHVPQPNAVAEGPRAHGSERRGLALVEALTVAAEKLGVTFMYETTGRSLLQDDAGNIRGVRAWARDSGNHALHARSVVIASGGYEGNVKMMTRYVGANAYLARPVSPDDIYNKD